MWRCLALGLALFAILAPWPIDAGQIADKGKPAPRRTVVLAIDVAASTSLPPALLVYVNGELASSVPATVKIELEDHPVPIEIGVAQFTFSPLYSFTLSAADILKGEIGLVVSNLTYKASPKAAFWSRFEIGENRRMAAKLAPVALEKFAITLPGDPYKTVATLWNTERVTPFSGEWYGEGIDTDGAPETISYVYEVTPSYGSSGTMGPGLKQTRTNLPACNPRPSAPRTITGQNMLDVSGCGRSRSNFESGPRAHHVVYRVRPVDRSAMATGGIVGAAPGNKIQGDRVGATVGGLAKTDNLMNWSGANPYLFYVGHGLATGLTTTGGRRWTIESVPMGATVENEVGVLGATIIVNEEIPETWSSYLAFKKKGYLDVTYRCVGRSGCEGPSTCAKKRTRTGYHLTCRLEEE